MDLPIHQFRNTFVKPNESNSEIFNKVASEIIKAKNNNIQLGNIKTNQNHKNIIYSDKNTQLYKDIAMKKNLDMEKPQNKKNPIKPIIIAVPIFFIIYSLLK